MRILFAAISILAVLAGGGCRRSYDQATPQAVLETAKKMVEKGDASRLTELIYADSKEMRQLLDQLGIVLGSLQDLGLAVQRAYPNEIEDLRKQAEESAKKGEASSFIARMAGQASSQMGVGRNRRAAGAPDEARETFDNAMKELFADPYGWIGTNEKRLTVQTIADDRAAIMWDGKPALGIGLTMQKDDSGKWYIVLPTSAPGVAQIMPKTQESWEIMGSLMDVFDNMLIDLRKDVEKGRARKLDDLAKMAGEKAFVPAVMVFFAYSKAIEAEKKAAKSAAPASPKSGG